MKLRGASVKLKDGSSVRVRAIEPTDKEELRRGFERLSEDSRYRRFLTSMPRLNDSQLAYLTEVDHRDHEALIAFDEVGGEGVGVARYVRGPEPARAEAAVTVVDDWQGRGLGAALTRLLASRALEEGISDFTALLLPENERMMELLGDVGSVEVTARDGAAVELRVPLRTPEPHEERALRGVLRAVASRPIELAARPGELRNSDRHTEL